MIERPDAKLISALVRNKCISRKKGMEFAALPLMVIPIPVDRSEGWGKFAGEALQDEMIFSTEEFALHECMALIHADVAGYSGSPVPFYAHVIIVDDDTFRVALANPRNTFIVTAILRYDTEKGTMVVDIGDVNGVSFHNRSLTKDLVEMFVRFGFDKDELDSVFSSSLMILSIFQAFCRFNNSQDRYLVKQEPLNPKRIKGDISFRERLVRSAGPTIVYMDKLPTSPEEEAAQANLTGREVRPHHRRGYHYTLRAERYRNHPYYGIEKKMYRKPTYVGDRTSIVNGTIYTILDK